MLDGYRKLMAVAFAKANRQLWFSTGAEWQGEIGFDLTDDGAFTCRFEFRAKGQSADGEAPISSSKEYPFPPMVDMAGSDVGAKPITKI